MPALLLTNARVFDGWNEECPEGQQILVEAGSIREISSNIAKPKDAQVVDLGGRTVMPGLIDAHIHAYGCDVNVAKIDAAGEPYRTAHAARMLEFALDSGFTTVRDVGGGDYSLSRAIEDRLIRGPRFLYAGKVLSMTGGHGDMRQASEGGHSHFCACGVTNSFAVIADGVDECIKAAREELRRGAHCIKIMASGGVASPTDPIWMNQYREDEIRAVVNETHERRTYTTAHCHPASSIRRCVECGVRVIEHGTLIDAATAELVAARGVYIVPTMAIIFALIELGKRLGFPAQSMAKVHEVFDQALSGMDLMRKAGVKIGLGTDLLGETYSHQCREFTLRREVFSPLEILRQATSVNAEILQQKGKLGCIAADAHADLIVVEGNPVANIDLLAANGKNLRLIMRAGQIMRNTL